MVHTSANLIREKIDAKHGEFPSLPFFTEVESAVSKTAVSRTSLCPSVCLKDLKIQMDVYRVMNGCRRV